MEAREKLFEFLEHDDLRGVPLVIMATKQDLPEAMHPSEVTEKFRLDAIDGREWAVFGTSVVSGEGAREAMDKMSLLIKTRKQTNKDKL